MTMDVLPTSDRYRPQEMMPLAPSELGARTPYDLQWWAALMLFGKSAPLPDDDVAHAKWRWSHYDDDTRKRVYHEAIIEFTSLQSSTAYILARLAVLAVVAAIGIQPLQSVINGASAWGTFWAWTTLALIGCTIICLVIIITPKLKVWAPHRLFVGALPTLLLLMENEDKKGWPRYLRLCRKIEHRRQLIRLERRLQVVGGALTVLSLPTLALSLALH